MSNKGIQGLLPVERRLFGVHPLVALGIFLSVVVLSIGDQMEIIPLFASLVASSFFPFFHEIHDLLAVAVALYAGYRYHTRLATVAMLLFLAVHIPYAIIQFHKEAPELLRILVTGFTALFGIWLIDRLQKSEELHQILFTSTPIGAYIVQDGKFLFVNPPFVKNSGYTEEELLGSQPLRLVHPEDREQSRQNAIAMLKGQRSTLYEYRAIKKTGDIEWVMEMVASIQYRGRRATLGHFINVTEHKKAEERIEHLTTVLKAIRNVNQLITHTKDKEILIQQICDLLEQRRGYQQSWVLLLDGNRNFVAAASAGLGENTSAFIKQLEIGNYPVCIRELLAQEQLLIADDQPGKRHEACMLASEHSRQGVFECKLEYEGKLYGVVGAAVSSGAVFDKEEQALFLELCNDIAFALANIEGEEWHQQVDAALRESEEKYRSLIDSALAGVYRTNLKGDILYINGVVVSMFDFDSADELIVGGTLVRFKNLSDRAIFIKELTEKGKVKSFEVELLTKTGKIKHVLVSGVSEGDTISGMLIDITERKQAEKACEIAEQNFRNSMDDSPLGIRIITEDGGLLYANKTILDIYGYGGVGELRTTPAKERYTTQSYAEHKEREELRRLGKPVPSDYEISIVRKDREIRHLSVSRKEVTWNGTIQFQVVYQDITARKKMQEQLMAQDRLASIGQLVSGVAHEINNPLTSVIGFSGLLLQRDLPDDVKADLKIVNDEAMRTAKIIKNLLVFARKQPDVKAPVDINEQIQRVMDLRGHEQKVNNISVATRFASDLPKIIGNGSQLQQVFFNIIINAEFFMLEAHKKGNLAITTERTGDFVRASFTDDGPGIFQETMMNLFTPFFTTKEIGKGTGLGLSICYGIITEHGGRIYAESHFGRGATFIVELPIKEETTSQETAI